VQVAVELTPRRVSVSAAGDVLLAGQLYAEVKVEDSTWFIGGCALQCFYYQAGCSLQINS
jgi:hypothetical protein